MRWKLEVTFLSAVRREAGDRLPPWYYGLAYCEDLRHVGVFYVIPLNYLARWAVYLSWWWNYKRSRVGFLVLTPEEWNAYGEEQYKKGRSEYVMDLMQRLTSGKDQ